MQCLIQVDLGRCVDRHMCTSVTLLDWWYRYIYAICLYILQLTQCGSIQYLCVSGGALFSCDVDQSELLCHIVVVHHLCLSSNRLSIGATQGLQGEIGTMQQTAISPAGCA